METEDTGWNQLDYEEQQWYGQHPDAMETYSDGLFGAIDSFYGSSGADNTVDLADTEPATAQSNFDLGKMIDSVWTKFDNLKEGTQSILVASIFKGLQNAFTPNYKARELDVYQQNLDLKRRQQINAETSTADSYDKTKYRVPGVFKPVGLINSEIQKRRSA